MAAPKIHLHQNDLPAGIDFGAEIAVDAEMMGLRVTHDRLCLLQLKGRDGDIHLVKITRGQSDAPNLKKLLEDPRSVKIFHYARIDIAMIRQWLHIDCAPVFCTKIASKLARTYTDRHGLKEIVREVTGIDLNKQQGSTDWGSAEMTQDQMDYAASDVLYLHAIMDRLTAMLKREERFALAQECFRFLPARAALDCLGFEETDIFAHS